MQLLPIRMFPAYRFGMDTPWGGNRLATAYGKPIPDERTGECLEVSVLPGLNSTDENGQTLSELIKQYGHHITGSKSGNDFPLLLKLIDAREQLSVQVHPNDELARTLEGKSGKWEAWLILCAEPGACILYGLRENTTAAMLREAAFDGSSIERLLQPIPVKAGDVIDIPSGTIHAIGAGITLYEIQQSSDVTYRLYDWQRLDKNGEARDLHIEKALASIDINARYAPAELIVVSKNPAGERVLLLKNKCFTLERWTNCIHYPMAVDAERFRILTAMGECVFYSQDSNMELMRLNCMESLILPADGIPMRVTCDDLLVVSPVF